jgi:hypothetical protein
VRLNGFTPHTATRAGAFDAPGREALLRYVLRAPIAQRKIEHQRQPGLHHPEEALIRRDRRRRRRAFAPTACPNGGGMAFVLSCTMSDRIAVVALVGPAHLLPWTWCRDPRPVPRVVRAWAFFSAHALQYP